MSLLIESEASQEFINKLLEESSLLIGGNLSNKKASEASVVNTSLTSENTGLIFDSWDPSTIGSLYAFGFQSPEGNSYLALITLTHIKSPRGQLPYSNTLGGEAVGRGSWRVLEPGLTVPRKLYPYLEEKEILDSLLSTIAQTYNSAVYSSTPLDQARINVIQGWNSCLRKLRGEKEFPKTAGDKIAEVIERVAKAS